MARGTGADLGPGQVGAEAVVAAEPAEVPAGVGPVTSNVNGSANTRSSRLADW